MVNGKYLDQPTVTAWPGRRAVLHEDDIAAPPSALDQSRPDLGLSNSLLVERHHALLGGAPVVAV